MEKEILIQNLRERLGADKSGVISDRTMDALAQEWLPQFADDSKITDETWKFPVLMLNNYAGQKLHDDAATAEKLKKEFGDKLNQDLEKKIKEAKEAAIAEYIKAHPAPQDTNGGNGGNGGGNDFLSEDIKKYIEQAKEDAKQNSNYQESLTKNFV